MKAEAIASISFGKMRRLLYPLHIGIGVLTQWEEKLFFVKRSTDKKIYFSNFVRPGLLH